MSELNNAPIKTPLKSESGNAFAKALVNCMEPLLSALRWTGATEHVVSALPYMTGLSSVHDFVRTMENLNYTHQSFKSSIQDVSKHFMPCLFVSESHQVFVLLKETSDGLLVFDGYSENEMVLKDTKLMGTVHVFSLSKSLFTDFAFFTKIPFLKTMIKPYRSALIQGVLVAFVLGIFALVVPLFSRMVFDQVIPSRSESILINFLFAIIVVIIVSAILNFLMSKLIIFSGVQLSDHVNNAVLKRLIFLSPTYTESTTVNAQVARVKDFYHVSEF
jgi:ATP-binding cassette, subfamily C, bacterial LapB